MKQDSSKGKNSRKTVFHAWAELAIRASVGTIWRPLPSENFTWVPLSALHWAR